MPTLVLIRHGSTEWTEEKRFTGWGDAPLSRNGHNQAVSAARSLKSPSFTFDLYFTSQLTRAKTTATIILDELGIASSMLKCDWRLNERHYGALQGKYRSDMVQQYGHSDVLAWRQNYHSIPPKLGEDDPRWIEQLERFPDLPLAQHPQTESMIQAAERTLNLWEEEIAPALKSGKNVLVIAHTNSIRSLIGILELLNDAQLGAFRISGATPRRYQLTDTLHPIKVEDLANRWGVKLRHWAISKRLKFYDKK